MLKFAVVALMSLALTAPVFGKTRKDSYPVPCSALWAAVKDSVMNSGNYAIIASDDDQMTASFNISGALGTRTNSVALSSQGTGCEMQVQSSYSGRAHDDAGDFKKRVEYSLAKLTRLNPSQPAKPADAIK